MAFLIADLGDKCDRRTRGLSKAVDALEEIRRLLLKSEKHWTDRERLLYTICDKTLQQIEIQIEEKGRSNGQLPSMGGTDENGEFSGETS